MKLEIAGQKVHIEKSEHFTICGSVLIGRGEDAGYVFGEITISKDSDREIVITIHGDPRFNRKVKTLRIAK